LVSVLRLCGLNGRCSGLSFAITLRTFINGILLQGTFYLYIYQKITTDEKNIDYVIAADSGCL